MNQNGGETEDNPDCAKDLFKESFKKFKASKSPWKDFIPKTNSDHDGDQVLLDPTLGPSVTTMDRGTDTDEGQGHGQGQPRWQEILTERLALNVDNVKEDELVGLGLRHPSTWKVYDVKFPRGFILIRKPFTPEGQRFWIKRSVIDFPKPPNITNIDNLENKEGISIKEKMTREEFYKKLRWVTFGYHHNWDTKVYSDDSKCDFPPALGDLTKFMADVLGFSQFKAEASIANYYHLDSTLSGHVDRSEAFQEAPLFSLSFGQSAVFLIGGRTKCVTPQAIHLRSGDVAIMAGESRFSYHAVPKVFPANDEPWNLPDPETKRAAKRPKLDLEASSIGGCPPINDSDTAIGTLSEWNDFLADYISKSRVNLNIRQVLFPGHTDLSESRRTDRRHDGNFIMEKMR